MATARKTTEIKKVKRTVYDEVETSVIELKLSEDEAKTLAAILGRVGGDPEFIRKHADSIAAALRVQIGKWYAGFHLEGHLFFKNINTEHLDSRG